ncbi:uncharacterized protein LOC124177374 [Neodiprion fabricii]|uniref:uncharacterized protein LOC124177374 n=1 Tax=Neodiprion fabricii TaxID=2872261 RepID=UPI001ED96128|nr:uncharacterized protein LOC124177374 [Neodiprion fabricii]
MKAQINSQEELVDTDLKLGMLAAAVPYFDEEDKIQKKILERYVPCKSITECYKEIPTGMAVATNKMRVHYLNGLKDVATSVVENVRQLPPTLTYQVSMQYVKGHAAVPVFNKFVQFVMQSGFAELLTRNAETTQAKINMRRFNFDRDPSVSLNNVKGGFYLLLIGSTLAGLLFICEMFQQSIREKTSRNLLKKKSDPVSGFKYTAECKKLITQSVQLKSYN